MPSPSRIAIVFPYFRTHSAGEILFPPLGAATLAGQLRKLGLPARIFDGTFQTPSQIQKDIAAWQPDIVGIYCMVTLKRNAMQMAESIRGLLPDSLLVAGGPLPTLYPKQFISHFDAVFRGESDVSFPSFCRDIFAAGTSRGNLEKISLEEYPGLFIQAGGRQVDNPVLHYSEEEIARFPLPDRGDFDHEQYQREWIRRDGSKTTSIMTTLGCPFQCDFCSKPIFGNLFRRRDLNSIFAEIYQIRALGYDSLWIGDDNFTLDPSFLDRFCERMDGRKISWSCLSRSDRIDTALTRRMKEAGCRRVYLGLESGSCATLERMNKRVTLDDGIRAVHQFHDAGIEVAAFFIVGYPEETIPDIESTFRLALSLPLDEISFNVPFPLPGSKLFDRVSGIDPSRDWESENETTFVYQSEFDPGWLRGRIRQTMNAFTDRKR